MRRLSAVAALSFLTCAMSCTPSAERSRKPGHSPSTAPSQSPNTTPNTSLESTPFDLAEIEKRLREQVEHLAGIGPRPAGTPANQKALEWIEREFSALGLVTRRQSYQVRGANFHNLEATVKGTAGDSSVVVLGAHYDTVAGTPGADDNASGVSLLLEIARAAKKEPYKRDTVLVAFTAEEPPYFRTPDMGSVRFAQFQKDNGVKVSFMISLEMVGFYDKNVAQEYPDPAMKAIYPKTGDFIALVSNQASAVPAKKFYKLLKSAKPTSGLAVESLIAPASVTGVDFSDHQSYWELGFPAAMITDTAFYRNDQYHQAGDTPDRLDYKKMAILMQKVDAALRDF